MEPSPSRRFFRGAELVRLLVLAVLMLAGWGLVWEYAHKQPEPPEPEPRAGPPAEPVVPDKAIEFETVTDRTPSSFRDNAAYAYLLEKTRGLSPVELAARSRRDIVLTHLWERPELYRGVPIHIQGTALRVIRYEAKMSKTGWLYEAWISLADARRVPYCCVFEEPPEGFPVGPKVSERVVFNGFFLKILKYEAGDTTRGSPVLIGKIGWDPEADAMPKGGPGAAPRALSSRTFWSLIVLGAMFLITMGRWIYHLLQHLSGPRSTLIPRSHPNEEIPPEDLDAWVNSQARRDEDWEESSEGSVEGRE